MISEWTPSPEDWRRSAERIEQNEQAIGAVQDFAIAERERLASEFPDWPNAHDIRFGLVAKQVGTTRTATAALILTRFSLMDQEWWIKSTGASPSQGAAAEIIHSFDTTHHNALIQGTFVIFDSGLRVIARGLGATDRMAGGNFKPLLDWLMAGPLASLGTTEIPALLNLLRLVRNTFHNNGVHVDPRGADRQIEYGRKTYKFSHGRPIEGGWLNAALWARGAVQADGAIARHPYVASLDQKLVLDPFSSQIVLPPWMLQREESQPTDSA